MLDVGVRSWGGGLGLGEKKCQRGGRDERREGGF